MKENKFNVGDVIVVRGGNVVGDYIIIARTADDYVLVSKFGDYRNRILSQKFIDKNATLVNTVEYKAEALAGTLTKAGISSEELSQSSKEINTTEKDNYNEKLVQEHRELTEQLNWLYKVKNAKYGDSFGKKVRKRGLKSALDRMEDKWNRLEHLIENNEDGSDTDESLEDTLVDLANYCLMTVMEINHAKENCKSL